MPKMDLAVVAAYGDDIAGKNMDITDEKDEMSDSSITRPRKKKKKRDGQDRVVSAQIYLAIIAAVLFIVIRFILPNLFQTLYTQYVEFISETPVWNLDGIVDVFSPSDGAAAIFYAEV